MIRKLCSWMLFSLMGWHDEVCVDFPQKYIICMAPHTSNWDFIIGLLYSRAIGMHSQFLMKKEWFFWPLGYLFRRLGGIPVYRSRHTSMTERMASLAKQSDTFALCITPEGTRSLNPEWKRGFYFIAQSAGIPILLFALDYGRKAVVCSRVFNPTGDVEADMKQIKLYFKNFQGCHPEKFTIGEV